jgi:methylmalonyl-CoA/ethylmalonyl-CoA epimerase
MMPKLHHVGIVQPDLESAQTFMKLLGLEEEYRGYVDAFQCWCLFCKSDGPTAIELVIPEGGPLAKFNKGAGGLHHFALETPDLNALQATLEAQGLSLLERTHVKGAGNFLCNFLSPIHTRGVLIEFVQLI